MRRPTATPAYDPTPETPELSAGVPPEFTAALEAEIAAIHRHGVEAAFPVFDGRFTARIGSRFCYTFEMERPLPLFWDGPADLLVPGRPAMDIILLSAEGLWLTASLPTHMGDDIPHAEIRYHLARILEKWIAQLEAFRERPNPAGERLLGRLSVSGAPADADVAADLDISQARSVQAALGHDTSVILGPPGSGKTRTIAEIVRHLHREGRSVLVASRTSRAADRNIMAIRDRLPASRAADGRILRVGPPRSTALVDHPELLLESLAVLSAGSSTEHRADPAERLQAAEARAAKVSRRIEILTWTENQENDVEEMARHLSALQEKKQQIDRRRSDLKEISHQVRFWQKAAEEAKKMARLEEEGRHLAQRMTSLGAEVSDLKASLKDAAAHLIEARQLYEKTAGASWLSRQFRQLPSPEHQQAVVDRLERNAEKLRQTLSERNARLNALEEEKSHIDAALADFHASFPGGGDEILRQGALAEKQFDSLNREIKKRNKAYHDSRIRMAGMLSERLKRLNRWGFSQVSGGTPEVVFNAIKAGYANATAETRGLGIDALRSELARLAKDIRAHQEALAQTHDPTDDDTAAEAAEARLLADAAVVVTTLSTACGDDGLHARKFDTVILDEAASAPLPPLWLAAGLARHSIVVVGDPNPLPPRVLSADDLARKWLGRDLFETTGIFGNRPGRPFQVLLNHRYGVSSGLDTLAARLLPPETPRTTAAREALTDRTGRRPGKGHATDGAPWNDAASVIMIDTGRLDAWITRVVGTDPFDRINAVSAAVCVSAARALLEEAGAPANGGDDPRVLIFAPYDAHAELINRMLREARLTAAVRAGTPESLQDTRAPYGILDLVEDAPFSGGPMFRPSADAVTTRRLAAALARVRRRLIVVGDADHMEKRARGAVVGSRFMPALRELATPVEAANLPPGRHDETAEHPDTTPFLETLASEIRHATAQVVIYSPILEKDSLWRLKDAIQTAVEKGVRIHVITPPASARRKKETGVYQQMEEMLARWKVRVIPMLRMHERLVWIDGRVLLLGSAAPLGPAAAGGWVWRGGHAIADFIARHLRIDDLVSVHDNARHTECPVCGSRIVAAAGRHWPFYWRCVEKGCYSRTIDQAPATETREPLRCARCHGEVEFGTWAGKPCWRCRSDRRHRQPIAKTHLTTPETAARIPARERARLLKTFGISPKP